MGTSQTIAAIAAALQEPTGDAVTRAYGENPEVLEAIRVARANNRGAEWIAKRLSTPELTFTRAEVYTYLRLNGLA